MNATLTLNVEQRQTLTRAEKKKTQRITPLVESLTGVISSENVANYKDDYHDYLAKKISVMKDLFVDTNIVIDLLAKREPFYREAQELFSLADTNADIRLVSALIHNMDVIITRNEKDFKLSKLGVMNAKQYVNQYLEK